MKLRESEKVAITFTDALLHFWYEHCRLWNNGMCFWLTSDTVDFCIDSACSVKFLCSLVTVAV